MVLRPIERALLLISAFYPEKEIDDFFRLSIGQRNFLLLRQRERVFGPTLSFLESCPSCKMQLEMDASVDDIISTPEVGKKDRLSLSIDGYEVQFRLPDSLDLLAVENFNDGDLAKSLLLQRCILEAHGPDDEITADRLPAKVIEAMALEMERADPHGIIRFDLSCPSCGNEWQVNFDIVSFFWIEIDAWAKRVLREVHTLASAYGWSEAEILAMSPRRRGIYLEMVSD